MQHSHLCIVEAMGRERFYDISDLESGRDESGSGESGGKEFRSDRSAEELLGYDDETSVRGHCVRAVSGERMAR